MSDPAMSGRATWSVIVRSCIVRPCSLVRHCRSCTVRPWIFLGPSMSGPAFSGDPFLLQPAL